MPKCVCISASFLVCVKLRAVSAEQKRNTPQPCKTDKCIDDSAQDRSLSAKEPGNKVKFKKTDQSPVDRPDDR